MARRPALCEWASVDECTSKPCQLSLLQGFRPGESVVVFGAGPVGLMAAYSAVIRGAAEVYVVDRVPERLQKAKELGCIPINFSASDPVDQILKHRGG
jgi:threonine dehydrogenase-like Zn-dependent dehydrogenase